MNTEIDGVLRFVCFETCERVWVRAHLHYHHFYRFVFEIAAAAVSALSTVKIPAHSETIQSETIWIYLL